MSQVSFESILQLPRGQKRSAALAAWFQGLCEAEGQPSPVLVGGGAVELYTGGAYTTGDLDFFGAEPGPGVERSLRDAGFGRHGRHWIHEDAEIFIELQASTLDEGTGVDEIQVGDLRVRALAPEAVLVDRLAAWVHWRSSLDGAVALLLYRGLGDRLDAATLRSLATRSEVLEGLDRLRRFVLELGDREPSTEEIEEWSREIPT